MEELVSRADHPARQVLPLDGGRERHDALHWTTRAALILLGVFLASTPVGMFLVVLGASGDPLASFGAMFGGLAVASLVAARLLGSE